MRVPSGSASQRSFSAPSDHSGTFTVYGTSAGSGRVGSAGSKQPVAPSVGGRPSLPAAGALAGARHVGLGGLTFGVTLGFEELHAAAGRSNRGRNRTAG